MATLTSWIIFCVIVVAVHSADDCSMENRKTDGGLTNCIERLKTDWTAKKTDLSAESLSKFVNVQFTIKADEDVDICCKKQTFKAASVYVNPTSESANGSESKGPFVTSFPNRGDNEVVVEKLDNTKKYTVMLIDFCDSPEWCTPKMPFIHWMVANIQPVGDKLTLNLETAASAMDQFPLMKLAQPNPLYAMVLLEQTEDVKNGTNMAPYVAAKCGSEPSRCKFNVTGYVADSKMSMIGVNWFGMKDDYAWAVAAWAAKWENQTTICTKFDKDFCKTSAVCKADGNVECKEGPTTGAAGIATSLSLLFVTFLFSLY